MRAAAPIVDQKLADLLAGERDPVERLAADQTVAMVWKTGAHANAMLQEGRLALLACGHFTITKSLQRAQCPRCGEMIRAGYDYDGFRNRGAADDFVWPADPLRVLHEKGRPENS